MEKSCRRIYDDSPGTAFFSRFAAGTMSAALKRSPPIVFRKNAAATFSGSRGMRSTVFASSA